MIILTGDGSHSINVPELNVSYHSVYGSIQESMHVFIEAGFKHFINTSGARQVNLFEMGFGSGLNALLTLIEAEKTGIKVSYEAVELYPLELHIVKQLNYCQQLNRIDLQPIFEKLHDCRWEEKIEIANNFILLKRKTGLSHYRPSQFFNLIYFDAFAPTAQPEFWIKEIFDKMYSMLNPEGILVTYCSKGDVRRNMIAAGFKVEKLIGSKRKREMIRAKRDDN